MDIKVNLSPGELIDKLTILEIKLERIADPAKLKNVKREYNILKEIDERAIPASDRLNELRAELKAVNETIWEIEDNIRDCERNRDFKEDFIELARGVYRNNDQRASIKRCINKLLDADIIEEKSYREY
ncbi:MAG: hypothetical protein JXB45_08740 [Candidatus Krumholzibacteriota bacterium]|nr:hypothetical protein [Candidatus Krumholzibacteriota bacterium]